MPQSRPFVLVQVVIWGKSNVKKFADPGFPQQAKVNAYFEDRATFWKEVYDQRGVFAEIHRDRHAAALGWIDSLALPAGSQALEIGCGAGFLAIALAQRGWRVQAIDSAESMLALARRHAEEAAVADSLTLAQGDVYALAVPDGSCDLVIALGVLPWLEQPSRALQEMARVTRPGGFVIVSTANRTGLPGLLDPWLNPAIAPLKRGLKRVLERAGLYHKSPGGPPSKTYHYCRFIDRAMKQAGLIKTRCMTRGFEFTLFRHPFLPEPFATWLHHRLQHLADRGIFGFRSMGMAYYILAQRYDTASPPTNEPQPQADC